MERGAVADLVTRARHGDEGAWDELVDRYLGMVHAICRGHRLDGAGASAVNEVVWLRLAEHLTHLRTPGAVGGWIAATARHECLRRVRDQAGGADHDGHDGAGGDGTGLDAGLLVYERDRALLVAFGRLDPRSQRLLRLLMADPRPGDDEIAAALDVPAANVAAATARALDRLRGLMAP